MFLIFPEEEHKASKAHKVILAKMWDLQKLGSEPTHLQVYVSDHLNNKSKKNTRSNFYRFLIP